MIYYSMGVALRWCDRSVCDRLQLRTCDRPQEFSRNSWLIPRETRSVRVTVWVADA